MIDVSIVLNCHRESVYLKRTYLSLIEAVNHAKTQNINCELIVVLDRSDEQTKIIAKTIDQKPFSQVKFIEVDFGSLGLSRNAGVNLATGEFVWTSDADDLISFNSISSMFYLAQSTTNCAIFPEYVIGFDEKNYVARYVDGDLVYTADFVFGHSYISRIFIKTETLRSIGYKDLKVSEGFAYEDWLLNATLWAKGVTFLVAKNTILFYRQTRNSLMRQIDQTSKMREVPHNPLFDRSFFVEKTEAEESDKTDKDKLTKRVKARMPLYFRDLFKEPILKEQILAAATIDPCIEIDKLIDSVDSWSPVFSNDHWGWDLATCFKLIGNAHFSDVVLLPFLVRGGGEKYILEVLNCLAQTDPSFKLLVITGQPVKEHNWFEKLPQNSVFLDVYYLFPYLSENDRHRMLFRLLVSLFTEKKLSRLHIKQSPFAFDFYEKLAPFVSAITDKTIFYRFCDDSVVTENVFYQKPYGLRFIEKHLNSLSLIISDHKKIIETDQSIFGGDSKKFHCLYTTISPIAQSPSQQPSYKLLWAGRFCSQKRTALIKTISEKLKKETPEITLFVAGEGDPIDFGAAHLIGIFNKFEDLNPSSFDALIYTSFFDGLPNIILEAMSFGLPVIAPDVGGICEVIKTGETGYLLPNEIDDDKMTEQYVKTIITMYKNWDQRLKLVSGANNIIEKNHSEVVFYNEIKSIF